MKQVVHQPKKTLQLKSEVSVGIIRIRPILDHACQDSQLCFGDVVNPVFSALIQIPPWAKGSALSEALTKQYSTGHQLDPDTIFPEVFSCDLEAIFPVRGLPQVVFGFAIMYLVVFFCEIHVAAHTVKCSTST